MTIIQIEIPDQLARSAQLAGLVNGGNFESTVQGVVRDWMQKLAAQRLGQAIATLAATPMTDAELSPSDIDAAIAAARGH